jgi:hypothetical protein
VLEGDHVHRSSDAQPALAGRPARRGLRCVVRGVDPVRKMLLGSSDPQLLAGLLYLGAGVGLAIGQAGRSVLGLTVSEAPLRRADMPWLAAIIVFGGVLGPLFLMLGLARTSAASSSLLLNLEGLATMVIAWVVFRENVDRRLLLGAAAILAGAIVLSWHGQAIRVDEGSWLIAAACIAWGIDNNLTRKLSSADPVVIALIKGLVAGGVNLALALMLGRPIAANWRNRRGDCRRIPWRRRQSRVVCAGAASSRQRADRRLFLARAVPRRGHRDLASERAGHASTARRRRPHGVRSLASSHRAACP